MSVTITVAQVAQYTSNLQIKYQQEGSVLRPFVRLEPQTGRYHYFDLLAPTAAVKNVGRHADTPLVDSQHERRRAEMNDYDWADLIDDQDRVRILINPEGAYVSNAVNAMGRAIDISLIEAFDANSINGESGATSTAFPAGNEIGGTGIPMSVDLLRQAGKFFDDGNVPSMDRHIMLAPEQKQRLLAETEVTSSDFNTVKALVRGEIDTFMGFMFHHMDPALVTLSGTERTIFAWHKRAMGLAMGMELKTDVGPRRDKRNSMQVYVSGVHGAVRIEDAGVLRIIADEA